VDVSGAVRFAVRVKPGASRTRVGGSYGDAELVVAVSQRAVDGKATTACLRAVADAVGVPLRAVRLVSGATRRTKILEVTGDCAAVRARLEELRRD
jgi:uncharacterized protein